MNTFSKNMIVAAFVVIGGTAMGMDKPMSVKERKAAMEAVAAKAALEAERSTVPTPTKSARPVVVINTRGADGLTNLERADKVAAEAKIRDEEDAKREKARAEKEHADHTRKLMGAAADIPSFAHVAKATASSADSKVAQAESASVTKTPEVITEPTGCGFKTKVMVAFFAVGALAAAIAGTMSA